MEPVTFDNPVCLNLLEGKAPSSIYTLQLLVSRRFEYLSYHLNENATGEVKSVLQRLMYVFMKRNLGR